MSKVYVASDRFTNGNCSYDQEWNFAAFKKLDKAKLHQEKVLRESCKEDCEDVPDFYWDFCDVDDMYTLKFDGWEDSGQIFTIRELEIK